MSDLIYSHRPEWRSHWRIMYRIDPDAILILEIFSKKTVTTPKAVIEDCRRRLRHYDEHGS
ncbi:MAG: type II toxin-antitoxin system RelE/ParE family toxin [Thermoanaerobaculia bacterium]